MPFFQKGGQFHGTFKRIISYKRYSQEQYGRQCLPIFLRHKYIRQECKRTLCHADDSGVFPELENKDVDLVMRTLSGL